MHSQCYDMTRLDLVSVAEPESARDSPRINSKQPRKRKNDSVRRILNQKSPCVKISHVEHKTVTQKKRKVDHIHGHHFIDEHKHESATLGYSHQQFSRVLHSPAEHQQFSGEHRHYATTSYQHSPKKVDVHPPFQEHRIWFNGKYQPLVPDPNNDLTRRGIRPDLSQKKQFGSEHSIMKFAGASHGSLTHSIKTLFSPSLSSHTGQGSLNAHEQFDGDYPSDVPGACKRIRVNNGIQQMCPKCDEKGQEIERLREILHKQMMNLELHVEGRAVDSIHRDYEDFFSDTTLQEAVDSLGSEALPCKLFQTCYNFVHETLIEQYCGKHMDRLFTVYNDENIPLDLRNVKNEISRLYLNIVTTFGLNRKHHLKDLKERLIPYLQKHVPECCDLPFEKAELTNFLDESLKLSWKMATCVPPMIASCDEEQFIRTKHIRKSMMKKVPVKHTLEYHCPVLYTNYTGHVGVKGHVEILSDEQPCQAKQDKLPTMENLKKMISTFTEESDLKKFAERLRMTTEKKDLVFKSNDPIHIKGEKILKWWLKRRRIEPSLDELLGAFESMGLKDKAVEIQRTHTESETLHNVEVSKL